MKKWLVIPLFILFILALQFFRSSHREENADRAPEITHTTPAQHPSDNLQEVSEPVRDKKASIINLDEALPGSLAQLNKNIIPNPGFEGSLNRAVVFVAHPDGTSFSDAGGKGYDDNYWTGASYEVRSGASAGKIGKIGRFLRTGTNGLPQYFVEATSLQLNDGDAVVLTKKTNRNPVAFWKIQEEIADAVSIDLTEKRPASPGIQSLSFAFNDPKPIEISSENYLEGEQKVDLLQAKGPWTVSFWAKANAVDASAKVLVKNGSAVIFEQEIPLGKTWQQYSFDFPGSHSDAFSVPAQLNLVVKGRDGKVWLDDVSLGAQEPGNNSPLRQEVVDYLNEKKPEYLRDAQGQSGNTLVNRLADAYGRRVVNDKPAFPYSLPELIQLAKTVNANPWIIVPATFSESEAYDLGIYLARNANKDIFPEVVIEVQHAKPDKSDSTGSIFAKIEEGVQGKVNLKKAVEADSITQQAARGSQQTQTSSRNTPE